MNELANKTLIMIVGPTAIGKSTLMREVVRLDPRFSYVRAFTTRPQRNGEKSSYIHLSEVEAQSLKDRGEALTWIEHPTTHFKYGTVVQSFQTTFNLQDTLASTVQMYRALPFARTMTISLMASVESWQEWLQARFPEMNDDLRKRLQEGKDSIEWSLAQTIDHHWLVNRPGQLSETARQVIAIATNKMNQTTAPQEATKLLKTIESLLLYK